MQAGWVPFSLSIISLCLFTASGLVIAWAVFRKVSTGAFLGSNPFAEKAALYARAEAVAGGLLATAGLVLGVLGEADPLLQIALFSAPSWVPLPNLFVGLSTTAAVSYLSIQSADRIMWPTIRRNVLASQSESWQQARHVLMNDGLYPGNDDLGMTRGLRDTRLDSARGNLTQIEKLLELDRLEGDEARIRRLEEIF